MGRAAAARLVRFVRSRDSRTLVLVRGIRSISQGALVVDFALYLRALHWSGGAIGGLLTASMAAGIVLTAVFGPLSDRIGRKQLLLGFEASRIVAAALALASADVRLIVLAAMLGQYGRGGSGSAGPFGAVEQAWLSHSVPREERVALYSLNSAMGFLGQGTGALLAVLPAWLGASLPGDLAFRPLFALAGFTSALAFLPIRRIPETPVRPRTPRTFATATPVRPVPAGPVPADRHQENRLLLQLALANLLQGAGVGLSGRLVAYCVRGELRPWPGPHRPDHGERVPARRPHLGADLVAWPDGSASCRSWSACGWSASGCWRRCRWPPAWPRPAACTCCDRCSTAAPTGPGRRSAWGWCARAPALPPRSGRSRSRCRARRDHCSPG